VKFSLRKTEKEKLVDVLYSFDGTLDEVAKTVWDVALDAFLERELWVVVVNDPGVCIHTFGPYGTKNEANKAIAELEVCAASRGARGLVMKIDSSTVKKYFSEDFDVEMF